MARGQRRRGGLFELNDLESRILMAYTPEMKWMIQYAGGTVAPSPALTVTTNLPTTGGFPKTTSPSGVTFSGTSDEHATKAVKVNGVAASLTQASGAWTLANGANVVGLTPGINRVAVRSYDGNGAELTRKTLDVWYDDGGAQNVSGTISGNTTWTAAGGPYQVMANVTIPAGSSLTIEAGTSVYFAVGTRLTVNGLLTVAGTDFQHVRFTRDPNGTATWSGLTISGSNLNNSFKYADFFYAGAGASDMIVTGSKADLDHVTWANPGANQRVFDVQGTSTFSLTNSVIPTLVGQEPAHFVGTVGAYALVQGNAFGTTTGHNDIYDLTGGNRPGNIFQILDNVFTGTGTGGTVADDILDIDGTDAHIEGNVFMNVQPSGQSDTNSAISGGGDSGNTSEVVSVRNFFYNVDHGFLMKEGNSVTSINDTFVHVLTGVFNFDEPGFAASKGRMGLADGDVFVDVPTSGGVPVIVQNPPTGTFTVINSIAPGTTPYPGAGNIAGYAVLRNIGTVTDPTVDFQLLPGSPAIGKGPNGTDMGAAVPFGVSLAGEPDGLTNQRTATLTVGTGFGSGTNAAGYTTYKYRLNGGAYSAETPIGTPITLTGLADGAYTVYAVGKNDAGVWQADGAATASGTWIVDGTPPRVAASTFNYQLARQSIALIFSEGVQTPGVADLTLVNQTTGQTIDPASMAVTYDAASTTETISFPGIASGHLPDGNYKLTVNAAGVKDLAANTLDGNSDGAGGDNFNFSFFQLGGDANRDRTVDFNDLVKLAQNYNTGGKSWPDGDFNGDGAVDFNDLVILAQNYNTSLPAAPAGAEIITLAAAAPMPPLASVFSTTPVKRPDKSTKVPTLPPVVVAKPKPTPARTLRRP